MATVAEERARRRAGFLRLYEQGLLSANELFTELLDTFSEDHLPEELYLAGTEVRERMRAFLAGHRPATFRPFIIGVPPTEEEAVRWEQERQRKYAALLLALDIKGPPVANAHADIA